MSNLVNENIGPKIWFVTQGATFRKDTGMKFLWAPEKGKDNKGRFFWENVFKVKKGDIIFNYSEGELKGVSIAKNNGYKAVNGDMESPWGPNGFRVDIDLVMLNPGIRSDLFTKNVAVFNRYLSNINNKPFSSNGSINQGYLYEFSKEGGKFLREIYGKPFGNDYIDEFFDKIKLKELETKEPLKKEFNHRSLISSIADSNLFFNTSLIIRLLGSLQTKPFLILTGLSGSGKTKLAQSFVKWISSDQNQYKIIPVGADWTNREPLLGYPNALNPEEYIKPENDALSLLIGANYNPDLPYFLILDEMNLSHVERYFADFLSSMESGEEIFLHSGLEPISEVPPKIRIPKNLFIIGTVNIDETTHMFSPKVLDRANTIEFRITPEEMTSFLDQVGEIHMENLESKGAGMAKSFLAMALDKSVPSKGMESVKTELGKFFVELKKVGAEFGYRSATEILKLIDRLGKIDPELSQEAKLDIAIIQKLLPKLHGSRRKLVPVLTALANLCLKESIHSEKETTIENKVFEVSAEKIKFPISHEKLSRMHKAAIENGFASFAEA